MESSRSLPFDIFTVRSFMPWYDFSSDEQIYCKRCKRTRIPVKAFRELEKPARKNPEDTTHSVQAFADSGVLDGASREISLDGGAKESCAVLVVKVIIRYAVLDVK